MLQVKPESKFCQGITIAVINISGYLLTSTHNYLILSVFL